MPGLVIISLLPVVSGLSAHGDGNIHVKVNLPVLFPGLYKVPYPLLGKNIKLERGEGITKAVGKSITQQKGKGEAISFPCSIKTSGKNIM